jgi:hypothetical protein
VPAIPSFSEQQFEAICDILVDTSEGLTGSEIGRLLSRCGIADLYATASKRSRLYQALSLRQRQDKCANHIIHFIQVAMGPVR